MKLCSGVAACLSPVRQPVLALKGRRMKAYGKANALSGRSDAMGTRRTT